MAQIRGTIELLSRIIKSNGASKMKAEIFRQAKFNGKEAVAPLWRLLFELLYYVEYNVIDDVALKSCGELSTEELVIFVKHELQQRGFCSRDFASLPHDMSDGSRELLLALGWLLCREHVINRFMINCTSPLDDDTAATHQEEIDKIEDENEKLLSESLSGITDPAMRVQQLLWLNNKMRLSLRNLHALQHEKNMLKHKIHEATQGVILSPDRNHLSMLEVYMLRHPEILRKNLQLLEKDNERLNDLLRWREEEDVFWKWMESVLDAKLQELNSGGSPNTNGVHEHTINSVNAAHLNLREAIVKYENIVEELEGIWDSESSTISEEELDNILASIDLELSIQRANIALNNTAEYLKKQSPASSDVRYNYIPQQKHSNYRPLPFNLQAAGSTTSQTGSEAWNDIEDEISSLQNTVERLQNDIHVRRDGFRDEMQRLSEKLESAICIPPMSVKV